jgi:hypothetical protein
VLGFGCRLLLSQLGDSYFIATGCFFRSLVWRFGSLLHDAVAGYVAARYAARGPCDVAGYGLPVVAVTACTMAEDREKFIEAGGDDYISKPLASGVLVNLVKKWTKHAQMQTS